MAVEQGFALAEVWGRNVAERREALHLSQVQLAELCDVAQQTISKIERGDIVPRDALKQMLADRLRTTPAALFPWPKSKAS